MLTEDNLQELVRPTSEEMIQSSDECRKRLELLDIQISEVASRLGKLYDALESGSFQTGELAPRIRELTGKKEELQQVKAEVEEALHYQTVGIANDQVVRDYVSKLKTLLAKSSITEQRSVINSFCNRIEVDDAAVKMYYTVPVPPR